MFRLEIKTGGAAFRSETETDEHGEYILDPCSSQLRMLLRIVEDQLECGFTEGSLRDCNGNKVGGWSLE